MRRRFPARCKLKILEEADRCAQGELGALLRREGLYLSNLLTWRRQREEGTLKALEPKKRGRKDKARQPPMPNGESLRAPRRLKERHWELVPWPPTGPFGRRPQLA